MKKNIIIFTVLLLCFIGFIIVPKNKNVDFSGSLILGNHNLITKDPNIKGHSICDDYITIEDEVLDYKKIAKMAIENKIVLETKEIINVNKNVFHYKFDKNVFSNEMYLYSMCFLSNLLKTYNDTREIKYLKAVDKYIGQLMNYTKRNYNRLTLKSSTDQSFFMRSAVFVDVLKYFDSSWRYYKDVVDMLDYQRDWLIDENHFNRNNHGLMTNIALIILSDYYNDFSLKELGISRTIELLNDSFTIDGLNNENTPAYQEANIGLYNGIYYLVKNQNNFNDKIQYLESKISKMNDTLSLILWQNNYYPPIGDGGSYLSENHKSINESSCFNEGYISLFKNDKQYVSFISNYTSVSHKQVDDLSVTFRYDNSDVLIDSGRYNYDPNDDIRKYVESCKGHSGICTKSMDRLNAREYISQNVRSLKGECTITDHSLEVSGKLYFNDSILSRNIKTANKEVIIHDSWELNSKEDIIIRFKFVENVKKISNDKPIFEVDGIKFKIIFDQNADYRLEYEKGFYSYRNNKKTDNNSLKIVLPNQEYGSFITKLMILE